jgi:predicted component of type VI protein secretion system
MTSNDRTPVTNGREATARRPRRRTAIKVFTDVTGERRDGDPPPNLMTAHRLTPENFRAFLKATGATATVTLQDRIFGSGSFVATISMADDPDRLAESIARQLPNTRRALAILQQVQDLKRRINRDRNLRRQLETMLAKDNLLELHATKAAIEPPRSEDN